MPKHYQPKEEPKEEEDLSAIQDLLKKEEEKVEEAHKEGIPHLHKGLPYDIPPEHEDEELEEGGKMGSLNKTAKHWREGHVPKRGMEVSDVLQPERDRGTIVRVKPAADSTDYMSVWVYVKWHNRGQPKCQRAWTVREIPGAQKSLFTDEKNAAALTEFKKGMRVKCGQHGQYGTVINVVNKEKNIVKVKMDDGHIVPFFGVFLYPVGDPQESLFDEGMSVDPQDDLMFDELAKLEKQRRTMKAIRVRRFGVH